ncbi:protein of unknown function [Bradyrhizobium sp. ORS 285]|nr:hypothetical protein BRAO285_480004 [Bradyrhizobium sp. ORS 285]SMX56734.1 protein of unknown function [Bradyrhizobium sp. ORS 285]
MTRLRWPMRRQSLSPLMLPAQSRSCFGVPAKINLLLFFGICAFISATRLEQRDERVVTIVEVGCDGRDGCARRAQAGTDGEVVWSWPLDAEVKSVVVA